MIVIINIIASLNDSQIIHWKHYFIIITRNSNQLDLWRAILLKIQHEGNWVKVIV